MNGNGNRKLKAYYVAIVCIMSVIIVALFKNVTFTGDNIVTLTMVIGGVAALFFGGNAAEWIASRQGGINSKPAATINGTSGQ